MKAIYPIFLCFIALECHASGQSDTHVDTAVIGAGLAGLRAGMQLESSNIDFQIFEARDRIGGRTYSEELMPGIYANMGGTFINSGHKAILEICQDLEIKTIPIYGQQIYRIFFFNDRIWQEEEIHSQTRSLHEKLSMIQLKTLSNLWLEASYGAKTIKECLIEWKASELVQSIVRQLFATEDGFEVDEISCMELIEDIIPNPKSVSDVFHSSIGDEKYMVEGGMNILTERMAANFRHRIQLEHQLVGIQQVKKGWKLELEWAGERKIVLAKNIISTLPLGIYPNISIDSSDLDALLNPFDGVKLGRDDKVFLLFKSQFWDANDRWLHILTRDFEFRGPPQGLNYPYIMAYRSGSLAKKPITAGEVDDLLSTLISILGPQVLDQFIGYKQGTVWAQESFSLGSYTGVFSPSKWHSQPDDEAICLNNICVAGEAFAQGENMGFMNGAIETGLKAAQHFSKI